MIKNYSILKLIILAYMLVLLACANIVTPSGGPVDKAPPIAIRYLPENHSINFTENKIIITFNEFITLNDPINQIIVSPPFKEAPEYLTKGKSLIININDTLKENTTYTILPGTGVKDITEGNPARNMSYIFSTTGYIDTMKIAGTVTNAFTLEAEKDVFVMLYIDDYDSIPYKEIPYYIAKTNSTGYFEINNIAPLKYKVFALKDVNYNLIYDQPNEHVAFSDSLIRPQYIPDSLQLLRLTSDTLSHDTIIPETLKKINLLMFQEDDITQKILKTINDYPGMFILTFAHPVRNLSTRFISNPIPENDYFTEYNRTSDTIIFWLPDPERDSISIVISDNEVILDTLLLALKTKNNYKTSTKSGKGGEKTPFTLSFSPSATKLRPGDNLILKTSHPIKNFKTNEIIIYSIKDSVTDTIQPLYQFTGTTVKRQFEIVYNWESGTKYKIFIPPGSFYDIYGLANDTVDIGFSAASYEEYGNLEIKLHFNEQPLQYVIQLLDNNNRLTGEIVMTDTSSVKFNLLEPGNYKARVIIDNNRNGKWDTGSYPNSRQPETIYYLPIVNIRANWDSELDWEL